MGKIRLEYKGWDKEAKTHKIDITTVDARGIEEIKPPSKKLSAVYIYGINPKTKCFTDIMVDMTELKTLELSAVTRVGRDSDTGHILISLRRGEVLPTELMEKAKFVRC